MSWQSIWAAATGSETLFSPRRLLLLDQEIRGERSCVCKPWEAAAARLNKPAMIWTLCTTDDIRKQKPDETLWVCFCFFLMECIFSRYENRSHVETRNWTVATKGTAITVCVCVCNDGSRKACQRSITPVALDKGHRYLPPCVAMTAAQRHVCQFSWRDEESSGEKTLPANRKQQEQDC